MTGRHAVGQAPGEQDFDRLPPHDIQAEQIVLGAMMLDPAVLPDVTALIGPADHYRPQHQVVHEAIARLAGRGDPFDPVAVAAELERSGDLRSLGDKGKLYLHDLIEAVPTAANAGYYARNVRTRSRLRRIGEVGTRVRHAAGNPGAEPDEVLSDALADLAGIAEQSSGDAPRGRDRAQVIERVKTLRIDASARAALAAELAPAIPDSVPGHKFLAQPDDQPAYRIDRLWPAGGNVVLAAQFKAGKTTLRDNLIRSLCDGAPFLGRFPVTPIPGRVFLIDCEMPPTAARRWLNEQMISQADRFEYLNLRAAVASFAILVPEIRAEWARRLADAGTSILILDCVGPVLAALGLDENKATEAGRFLAALEELLAAAEVAESFLIHHMGHDAERSRGASRLRDWPDAEWRLVRQDDNPASARYLSAFGRDVDFPESRLDYDAGTRHLAIGGGSRRAEKSQLAVSALITLLRDDPDLSANAIEKRLGDDHARQAIRDALADVVKAGRVRTKSGTRGAKLHFLNPDLADLAGPRRPDTGEV